jgi:quercetin dioxygenase-like cupin family protein
MSEPNDKSGASAVARIEAFLSAVDRALGESGVSAEERQNVKADLHAQIEEMISARIGDSGKTAGPADVDAVLGELDPPESYVQVSEGGEKVAPDCARGERGVCSRGRGPRWFWGRRRVAMAIRQAMQSFGPFADPTFAGLTPRARRALMLAKGEAFGMNHQFIGTEHLVLGLLLEGEGVGGRVLLDLGMSIDRAREEVKRLVGPGIEPVTRWMLPITPRTKQALDFARTEARNLGHSYVGTEHLLLGVFDTAPDSVGSLLLVNMGIAAERVRAEVMRRVSGVGRAVPSPIAYWPASAAREIKVGGNRFRIIASGGDTGGAYAAMESLIESSDGLGLRRQSLEDISVYVLEGSVRVRVEERTVEMGKGDFVRIPRGVLHEIQRTNEMAAEMARVMLIATPAGMEKMIGEMGENPEGLREIALRYGVGRGIE